MLTTDKQPKKHCHQFTCMTTPCEIILYAKRAKDAKKVAYLIEKNTRRLEQKYNFFSDNSFISTINNRSVAVVKIDAETHQVLSLVKALSANTNNIFDITTGTLKQCAKLASIDEIEHCRKRLIPYIGADKWWLTPGEIHFANRYVKIDLGGVIKEYAVDQAGAIAKKAGLSALINFGGDIYVNGKKPDNTAFTVAIKNPKNPQQNIAMLTLTDQGLTTSAHYERSRVVEGKSYSHIISNESNKKDSDNSSEENSTASNADNNAKILSATVISSSVLTSGIYSTALMLNANLAIDPEIHVVLIDEQLRLHQNIFN
ncbi:hypothetical protein CMT41_11470 [Colwellia sp. MT41]|uniref:FAD:protein FMN transferase n=1 Tax=Colwellia sp. MT41 TaxID=58049 RepID=UPI0007178DCC|nr:FAD:protein FMN transferase [Colwellia sp. MT41]ALO35271.1 hypothetical protein CMT41_11470 [Colwellia sp. MT41]